MDTLKYLQSLYSDYVEDYEEKKKLDEYICKKHRDFLKFMVNDLDKKLAEIKERKKGK